MGMPETKCRPSASSEVAFGAIVRAAGPPTRMGRHDRKLCLVVFLGGWRIKPVYTEILLLLVLPHPFPPARLWDPSCFPVVEVVVVQSVQLLYMSRH